MKKLLLGLVMSTMLVGQAQAGILILTGDIGNKFDGYKTVGWLVTIFTGATIIGLVVDGDQATSENVTEMPELSETSLELISEEIEASADMSIDGEQVIKVSPAIAEAVIALEGFEGMKAQNLFNSLTK